MDQVLLGEQIARNRKRLGLTQEGLAARLRVTNQAVSKWENNQSCPDLALLPLLADLFGITLDELFGRASAEPASPPEPEASAASEVPEPLEAPAAAETPAAPDAPAVLTADLPWPDDGNLRAVCFLGRRLVEHQPIGRASVHFLGLNLSAGKPTAELHFTGTVRDIHSAFDVVCTNCTIEGNVSADDSVKCGADCTVGGNVTAGDGVTCGDVGGSVEAGDSVRCGNIEGDATAGDSIRCSSISGRQSHS